MNAQDRSAKLGEVRQFWGELYRSAYAGVDGGLDEANLNALLNETEAMFRLRAHLAVTEMPLQDLAGKRVLEVGCGAGSHSALFARRGAQMSALDLTFERARATKAKFGLLGARSGGSAALTGNGEQLPFADGTFDIVYSNGVFHHSPDTQAAINEVFRVLRPGGHAVIMLYCKSSINYWITFWLGYGVLRGQLLRGRDILGARTEWAGSDALQHENPITRAYTKSELEGMFAEFEDLRLRKSEFSLSHLPKFGRWWRRRLERSGRTHQGGLLPYGEPWPLATAFELWLGRYLGWAWNISAVKPRS